MKKPMLLAMTALLLLCSLNALALYANKDVSLTPLLKTSTTWNGAVVAYPTGDAEVSALIVEIAPGGETGWHLHTVPSVAIMLEGAIEVHLKDGQVKQVKQGEALAEVVNTLHNGKNLGTTPARMAVFYAGSTDATLTLTEAEAALKRL